MKPTDKELRELDAWIAEHVMGWKTLQAPRVIAFHHASAANYEALHCTQRGREDVRIWNGEQSQSFRPTADPAAMMVLEKCLEVCGMEILGNSRDGFDIYRVGMGRKMASAKTLPLAICLFAKQLFSK